MQVQPHRLYVHDAWPRWLAFLLGVATLAVLALYFAAPDVPKLEVIPLLILVGGLVFLSHRASLSWIEISADGKEISSAPSWYARKLLGEKAAAASILPGSELRLFRNFTYGLFNGYSAVLCAPDGLEQVFWKSDRGLRFSRCREFADEVNRQFGLPVRLSTRRETERGVEESDWTSLDARAGKRALALGMTVSLLPCMGVAVRWLTSDPFRIALSGLAIWLLGVTMFAFVLRTVTELRQRRGAVGTLLLWAFRFALLYLVTVLVTGAVLKR
jgi:hypothetical protein